MTSRLHGMYNQSDLVLSLSSSDKSGNESTVPARAALLNMATLRRRFYGNSHSKTSLINICMSACDSGHVTMALATEVLWSCDNGTSY